MADNAVCSKCGKTIRLTCSNWKEKDGEYMHKKCPGAKGGILDDAEKIQYRALTDRVKYHFINNASDFIAKTGVNFKYLAPKIKQLKEDGYSYEDQIYALDQTVEIQGAFNGFGAMVNMIPRIIAERDRVAVITEKVKTNPIPQQEEIRINFDLSTEATFEW